MNDRVESRLRDARPSTVRSTPELDEALRLLITDSEDAAAGRRRSVRRRFGALQRRTKVIATTALAVVMIGTASAAIATQPWTWHNGTAQPDNRLTVTLPSGKTCEIRAVITEADPALNDDAAAMADARAFAATIDMRTFDVAALRTAGLRDGSVPRGDSPDQQASLAIMNRLSELVFAKLSADGFTEPNVSVYSEDDCGVQP
jgi:hypothetical protein